MTFITKHDHDYGKMGIQCMCACVCVLSCQRTILGLSQITQSRFWNTGERNSLLLYKFEIFEVEKPADSCRVPRTGALAFAGRRPRFDLQQHMANQHHQKQS